MDRLQQCGKNRHTDRQYCQAFVDLDLSRYCGIARILTDPAEN